MSAQTAAARATLSTDELKPWARFLRAHAAVTRRLNAELVDAHGLTLNDYEVLLVLAHAPERQLKRRELAEQVVLTASGITRLLDGLEREQYVERAACASDARVVYARLTDAGHAKLAEAARTHVAGIYEGFLAAFTADERETLAELLGRLPGAAATDEACEP